MIKPTLYHKAHRAIKQDVGKLLKQFSSKLQWRSDGRDTLLDVASGPGDVSMDYVYPTFAEKCERIVFSDISKDMLNFFKSNHRISPKCEFQVLDIASKKGVPSELEGQFDHLTSMLLLHWVKDTR